MHFWDIFLKVIVAFFLFALVSKAKEKWEKKKVVWAPIGYWESDVQQLTDKKGFVPSWSSKSWMFSSRKTLGHFRMVAQVGGQPLWSPKAAWKRLAQLLPASVPGDFKGTKSSQTPPEPQRGRSCCPALMPGRSPCSWAVGLSFIRCVLSARSKIGVWWDAWVSWVRKGKGLLQVAAVSVTPRTRCSSNVGS